jgi:hypothetical protein
MADFKTFIEYASEQRILALLIKERVKVALKSKLKNTQNTYRNFTDDFENLKISEQIAVLMPTRNWVRPQKKERFVDGVAKSSKQILTRSLALTIKRDKKKQLAKRPAYLNLQKAFIEDPNVMVFIGNIQAAGVGITLVVSNKLIFNNISFVPGDNRQMEDRCYRIGQTRDVDIYYQMYKGTQYEKMWNLVMRKELVINSVIKSESEK